MNPAPKNRIRIYTNVRQNLELAKRIFERHLADGETSALAYLDGFNWDATGPKISFCLEKHKEAVNLTRTAEETYRQRDAVLAEITDIIKASKQHLKNTYRVEPARLGEWGFSVYDSTGFIEKIPP